MRSEHKGETRGTSLSETSRVAGLAASAIAAPAIAAEPQICWRLASSFPKSLDTIYGGAEVLADRVRELTDGKFDIRVFAGGEIVPGLQVLDAVSNGTVEISHTCSYYYVGKNKAFGFDTSMPFGLNARQQNAWMQFGGGDKLMAELFDQYKGDCPGWRQYWHANGRLVPQPDQSSLADLKGLKMHPGIGGELMASWARCRKPGRRRYLPGAGKAPSTPPNGWGRTMMKTWASSKIAKNYYPGFWEPGP